MILKNKNNLLYLNVKPIKTKMDTYHKTLETPVLLPL